MVPPDCQTGYAASSAVTPTNVEPTEYSGAAVAGSAWTTLQTLANKVASVAAMYLLARMLLPADFGLASLAVSIGAFAFVIPPYVMGDVLISAPSGFGRRSGAALMAVWAVGILLALAMIVSAWPIQQVTGKLGIAAVLCVVAARPLADALMIVPMARMRLDLMFRRISMIDGVIIFLATASGVLMAWLGFGPMAIVAPPIATVAIRGVVYWLSVGREIPRHVAPGSLREVSREFALAGLGQYLNNIVMILEIIVLGWFANEVELGYFAFAFQLAMQANAVIAGQLGAVLQPIFGRLQVDTGRQIAAFLRSSRLLAAFAVPISVTQAAVAVPLFDVVFGSKWQPSIGAFIALSAAQGFMFAGAPAVALLKAQGRFRAYLLWQAAQLAASLLLFPASLLYGVSAIARVVACAGIPVPEGATLPLAIGCSSAVVWSIFSPIAVWIACRPARLPFRFALGLFLLPLLVSLPFGVGTWLLFPALERVLTASAAAWVVLLGVAPAACVAASAACCATRASTRADVGALLRRLRTRLRI